MMSSTTTCVSQCMIANVAPAALAKSMPERTASYFASLLVVGNWRWTSHSTVSPSDVCYKTPASLTRWLDNPSVHTIHVVGSSSSTPHVMNSTTKSATACALIPVRGQYWTSNSPSSTTHRTSHPAASRLFIAFYSNLSVWTTMVCAWKYGLSFRAAMISVKASFSIEGYCPSAPHSAQLV